MRSRHPTRSAPAAALALALLLAAATAGCGDDGEAPGPDGGAADAAVDAAGPRIGAPCSDDKACGSYGGQALTCLTQHNGVTWLGGYCALPCDTSAPSCPAGSACEREPIYTALDAAHCFLECTTAVDCRAGYWCSSSSYVCYPKAQP